MFIEVGFSLGLLAALWYSLPTVNKLFIMVPVFCVLLFLIPAYLNGSLESFGVANSIDSSVLVMMSIIICGAVAFAFMKRLRISIDELDYVAMLGIFWFVILYVAEVAYETLYVVGAVSIMAMGIVFSSVVPSRLWRFLLYASYTIMLCTLFFLFIGWKGLSDELFDLPNSLVGTFQAFAVGWAFFYYLVHLIFLGLMYPNRSWDKSLKILYGALQGKFRTTQHHVVIMIVVFTLSYGAVAGLQLVMPLVAAIGIIVSVVSYVSLVLHKRFKINNMYTQSDLIPDKK